MHYYNGTNWMNMTVGIGSTPFTLSSIVTSNISLITSSSAISGGNLSSDGGASITAKGICWDTFENPTISSRKTNEGTGNDAFVSNLTGLLPNTVYYVRAYATNSIGTSYGNQVSFTSLVNLPIVSTGNVSSITGSSAICGGAINSDGGVLITSKGVCWSTSANPTIDLNTKTINGDGTNAFTSNIIDLLPNTRYYIRAYATNSAGTSYGNEINFTTATVLPTINTNNISLKTSNSAVCGGNIVSDGGAMITAKGVCWSTSANPTIALTTKTIDGTGSSSFSSNLTGLSPNTTYYVRAYATNSVGTIYGNQIIFTTSPYVFAGSDQLNIVGLGVNANNNNCRSWLLARLEDGTIPPNAPPSGFTATWSIVSGNNGCFISGSPSGLVGRPNSSYTLRYTFTNNITGESYFDDVVISFKSSVTYSITRNGGTNTSTIYTYRRSDGLTSDFQYINNGQTVIVCAQQGSINAPNGGSALTITLIGNPCN
jgi:hypothetical protein